MVRACESRDFEAIWSIVNDGARAYMGVIPADRLSHPYMSREELQHELDAGVTFSGHELDGQLIGVMGLQQVEEVLLVRHAYVRTGSQKSGIGTSLLEHLRTNARVPMLIGTWADAVWAIGFYEKHGFRKVGAEDKVWLLKRYWTVPDRQIETSVVLADPLWYESRASI